jgi:hypothetical protein
MSTFIGENIISEGGLTANTLTSTSVVGTNITATNFYGDGSNITNVLGTPSSPIDSVQFNNVSFLGSSNLTYDGTRLTLIGTSNFNGNFFVVDSNSAKLKVQWFGAQTAGTTPGIIWTNMPTLPTTWLHQSNGTFTGDATYIVDLTEYTQFRFFFSLQAPGFGTSTLGVQYSLNNSTWVVTPFVTVAAGTTLGAKDSNWQSIPVAMRTFVYLRLIGGGGNGVVDPRFSPPILLFR